MVALKGSITLPRTLNPTRVTTMAVGRFKRPLKLIEYQPLPSKPRRLRNSSTASDHNHSMPYRVRAGAPREAGPYETAVYTVIINAKMTEALHSLRRRREPLDVVTISEF